jgi:serine/threonine protein kinase
VKQFNTETFDQTALFREVETLVSLNHPCVPRILGSKPPIGDQPAQIRTAIAENRSLRTVLEKVGSGEHCHFWNPTGKGRLILGIALGMRFIHSKGIIHGDLKPANILVDRNGEALICDFGSSRHEVADYTPTPESGTVNYAAPELCQEDAIHTRKVDVYAFGLVAYEILTGTAVFPSSHYPFAILKRILKGDLPAIPDECGKLMQELIPRCWSMDPEQRPTFHEMICEFKAAHFRIVPRADAAGLKTYLERIEKWEADDIAGAQSK